MSAPIRRSSAGSPVLRALFLVGLAGLLGPLAVGNPQKDERTVLAERIRAQVERIQESRGEFLAAQRDHASALARLEAQIETLEENRDHLQVEASGERKRAADLESKLVLERDALARARADLTAMAASVRPIAQRMASRISSGIPHRRDERAAEFVEVDRILSLGDDKENARALLRFWGAVAEELRLLKTRQLTNVEVRLGGGRTKHAYVARLGLVNELFVSEDGETVGIAARRAAELWRLVTDPVDRQRIVHALQMLQQRRPPGVELLPFLLPVDRE